MKKSVKAAAMLALSGIMALNVQPMAINAKDRAGETALAGLSYSLSNYYYSMNKEQFDFAKLLCTTMELPENIAIANVNESLNIREHPGTNYNIIGYLPKDAYCIVHEVKDGWASITSNDIKGYVSTEYLYMGEQGLKRAEQLSKLIAIVDVGPNAYANLRSEPSTKTNKNVITKVYQGEELIVVEENIISKSDPEADLWVKVRFDDETGYISKKLVKLKYSIKSAVAANTYTSSALRASVVSMAKKYLGLAYVWGGESLTDGVDCSGYVREIFEACGISINNIPRCTYDMVVSNSGKTVSRDNIQPGDWVFYGDSEGNVNHVAMYIGNGEVIQARGKAYGVVITSIDYRTVLKIMNFIG